MSLDSNDKLVMIKMLHTLIWFLYVVVIGYVVYAGVANRIDGLVWYAIGLMVIEGIILVINKMMCPLPPLAARFTTAREENLDIYLPGWLARNNKSIFTFVFAFGVVMVVYRIVQ